MSEETDFDVVVVGGGLVGASLACALARSRLRLAVVEAVPLSSTAQPSYDDRAVALAYGSRRIFEGLGLWAEIERLGAYPIEHIHISDRGRFGFTRLHAADAGLPALGYVVPTRVLGTVLYQALHGLPNARLFCPAALERLDIGADGAALAIQSAGDRQSLRARLVVAADGAHSAVRQAAGIEARRTDYEQAAIVTNVTASEPHGNTAYERFTASGPLAILPMAGHSCGVVWSARRAEVETILGWSDEEFRARLQERFGERLGRFARVGRRVSYPLALTRVREHVRERLVLIGNAAHTVHPVAGQGFNLGLRDVAALTEIVEDGLRAGEDIASLRVLRRYAEWRVRDNQLTSRFTDGLIRIFSNDSLPLTLGRNLGLIAVDLLPPVKRGFIRMTSGLAGRLPRLARGLGGHGL
jgi:2-octaprenyl-6-methoxyphenol hydroxylase